MAKKRTLLPFYGKVNQRLEERAKRHAAAGDQDGAKAFFEASDKMLARGRPFKSYGTRKLSKMHPDHPYRNGRKMTAEDARKFES